MQSTFHTALHSLRVVADIAEQSSRKVQLLEKKSSALKRVPCLDLDVFFHPAFHTQPFCLKTVKELNVY